MPDALVTTTELIREAQISRVYVREQWSDDWEEIDYLEAESITWSASPEIGTATIRMRYGRGLIQGERAIASTYPQNFDRYWVKIEVLQNLDPPKTWHGQIIINDRDDGGALIDPDTGWRTLTGQQSFTAYDLGIVLKRQKIRQSYYGESTERKVGVGLTFNEPNQLADIGNRSQGQGLRGTHVFSEDLSTTGYADKWSTRQIVRYLLAYHGPVDFLGNDSIQVRIDQVDLLILPDDDEPVIESHGRTLKEILDRLMDRRRLLSYTVELQVGAGHMGDDAIRIRPFTFADEEVEIPDREPIPANAFQKTLDFDFSLDVESAVLKKTVEQLYDQVQVVGAPILCTGTFSFLDGTLERDWDGSHKTEYDKGAAAIMGAGPYGNLDVYEKQQRNNDCRAAEHLERVYRYFGLVIGWGEQVGNGEGGGGADLFPYAALGLVHGPDAGFYLPDLRFERYIPLKDGHDYTTIAGARVGPSDKKWEYRRPFVLIKCADEIESVYGKYQLVERLPSTSTVELTGDGAGRHFALSVRVQDDAPGIICSAVGAPQHAIASGVFAPTDVDVDWLGDYDYRDNLLATLCIKADYHCEARYPEVLAEAQDAIRILMIDARRVAELHYIAPGTVVDVEDGNLKRCAAGGFIRDDRTLLEAIAKMAWQWYGTPRQTISVTWRGVQDAHEFRVGDLIVQVGGAETLEEVRTVITSFRIDMPTTQPDGDRQFHRMTLQTQWAEMDPLAVIA